MKVNALIIVVAALTPAVATCDESFRCGGSLVSSESSVAELLAKCGKPASREVSTENVRSRTKLGGTVKVGTTAKEVWFYNRGSGADAMVVTIVDGKLQSIERAK